MPIAALAAGFCFLACSRQLHFTGFFAAIVAFALLWSVHTVPDYIYDEHKSYNEAVAAHASASCLYLTEYYAGVTQDMLQLMAFNEVYVSADPASGALLDYLAQSDSDELVVYIDVDSMWGSGYDQEDMLSRLQAVTEYRPAEHLYQYALSDTYLLRR